MTLHITRKDVARRAGVSTATVSYVVNNGPRSVAAATRERVLQAIEELGYYPNDLARSLSSRQTSTFGVIIPDLLNPIYSELARNLEEICFERNYMIFICNTNREQDKEQRMAELLRAKRVDGVFFLPNSDTLTAVETLQKAQIPVVVLEYDVPGAHCVVIDDFRGGVLATEHLIGLGHRRIGFIRQPSFTTSNRRVEGYTVALRAANLEVDPALVVTCESGYAAGMSAMQELHARAPEVTAVFTHNDVIAIGAMHAARQAKRAIPEDLSVIGFDNIVSAAFQHPPLSTISYPRKDMAQCAMDRLFAMMDNPDGQAPGTEFLPVSLVLRGTTAPVRTL